MAAPAQKLKRAARLISQYTQGLPWLLISAQIRHVQSLVYMQLPLFPIPSRATIIIQAVQGISGISGRHMVCEDIVAK